MRDEITFILTPEVLRRIVTIASRHLRALNAELSKAYSDQPDAAFAVAVCSTIATTFEAFENPANVAEFYNGALAALGQKWRLVPTH